MVAVGLGFVDELKGWVGGLDGKMRVSYRRGGLDLLTRDTMCEQFLASILI